jgi:hypothetical protein
MLVLKNHPATRKKAAQQRSNYFHLPGEIQSLRVKTHLD